MMGIIFHANFNIFARITALHSTTHDELDISDAIESSPHTLTADNLQHNTSPTPDSSIHFLPKLSTPSKSKEQSVSDEEHSTALGLDVPTVNRTGLMIRRPALDYDYDFSTDENCNFAIAASVNGNVPFIYEKAIVSADTEKWQAAMHKKWDLVVLPLGKPITKLKGVFDIKRKSDGSIER